MQRRAFLTLAGITGIAAAAGLWYRRPNTGQTSLRSEAASTTGSTNASSTSQATTATSNSTSTSSTTAPSTTASSTTASSTTSSSAEPAAALVVSVLCREAWGAKPAGPGMVEHPIDRITLHHSAGPSNLARNAPGQIRSYQRLHQTSNGWPDIAYHFLIDAAGNIYEGRDPLYRGDTGTNYDPTGHFLVCFDGDYGAAEPSEAQLAAAVDLFAWACQIYDVNPETLGGHRDFAATECPGDALYTVIANGSMAEAISARMAEGELQFTDICGDAAETTIARIEAGA